MSYNIQPLTTFQHSELTRFWNRAFTDHVSDFQMTEEELALRLQQGHADGPHSLVLMEGGRFAGLSIFGRLGARGGILGFGIDPNYRGRSLARRLIKRHVKELSALKLDRLGLEVASQNRAAHRAYAEAGFKSTRDLLLFSGPITHPDPLTYLATIAQTHPLLVHQAPLSYVPHHRPRLSGNHPSSFDRSFSYWSAHPVAPIIWLAGSLEAPEALLATRVTEDTLELVDAIGSREGLATLLLEVLSTTPGWARLTCADEPADSPTATLLQELGVPVVTRWTEMLLRPSHRSETEVTSIPSEL